MAFQELWNGKASSSPSDPPEVTSVCSKPWPMLDADKPEGGTCSVVGYALLSSISGGLVTTEGVIPVCIVLYSTHYQMPYL